MRNPEQHSVHDVARRQRSYRWVVLGWAALALFPLSAHADDWSQWGRTSARNMVSPEIGLPSFFNPGVLRPGTNEIKAGSTRNIRWVAKLGSQTYGNVSVAGGRVFVGTNTPPSRQPHIVGSGGVLMSFDEKSGAFLWRLNIPKLGSGKTNEWENLGICSSPTVEGERVYVVTNRGEILCLDAKGMADGNQGPFLAEEEYRGGAGEETKGLDARDADIIWRFDMRTELGVFPHNIASSSVLIVGDRVYVNTSNGVDWSHGSTPSPFAPCLIVLDKKTGKFLGEENSGISERLLHGNWSSPSFGSVKGRGMIFFGGGDGYCYAFDPEPRANPEGFSELKEIWRFDANPPHYRSVKGVPVPYYHRSSSSEIIATPVFYKNRVYTVIGQDPSHGPGAGALTCINPSLKGDISKLGKVWAFEGIGRSLSTVAIHNDLLFTADLSGKIYCLDVHTGSPYWVHDTGAVTWSSPVVADGKIYIGNENGALLVFDVAKKKRLLYTAKFPGPIYSSVVVANKALFVTTHTHLFKIEEMGQNSP